jgi:hypothetical protein
METQSVNTFSFSDGKFEERSIRPSGTCRNCQKRSATEWWTEDGGTLAFVHGMGQPWCRHCCLDKQIRHAWAMSKSLPKLLREVGRLRLRELLGKIMP